MDIWFTSDTHFNHENILKFEGGRPEFSSVEEMNEVMIENWNSVVKPGDRIYHLGDVFFGSREEFKKLWPRLNGSKRLIVGNHDDIKFLSSGGFFKKVYMWRMFTEHNFVASHVPLHPNSLYRHKKQKWLKNVHGHTHRNGPSDPNYRSVCVEMTNYTPVHLDELKT